MSMNASAAGPSPTPERSGRALLRRALREPLLHCLVVGLALFLGYRALHPDPGPAAAANRIELTADDFLQMSMAWLAQGRPPPTREQMGSLIELKVREEVLYREALALGLDKEDTIVKRRLAQKMEFLADNAAATAEPGGEEVRTWFRSNAQRFASMPRVSFRHLYFSTDQRGEGAQEAAGKALAVLATKPADWPEAAALADPFMFQDRYGDRSFDEIARQFGPDFAAALLKLRPGSWLGPVSSGYGVHLIFVEALVPSRVPDFEEVEQEATAEWVREQRLESRRKAYETMRARYDVVLPKPPAEQGGDGK